jgi:ABC-type multidrug transport system fused ATPase/permease subunit
MDILMGFLMPDTGSLIIDGQKITHENYYLWQACVAHVPQSIFLTDSSVAENIALGTPKELIDFDLIRVVARQAQIAKDIESWPNNYNTIVGERGVRLSGGQRQRIGIARALYKQCRVIVFDEATSALDTGTEGDMIEAINHAPIDITLIMVAHRLITLRNCDLIIELNDGMISRLGSYKDLCT